MGYRIIQWWRTGGGYCPRHQPAKGPGCGPCPFPCDGCPVGEMVERIDAEFTPSESEAIHRAMVREEQGRQMAERGMTNGE